MCKTIVKESGVVSIISSGINIRKLQIDKLISPKESADMLLSEVFRVDASSFSACSLKDLDLSNRAMHVLEYLHCKTVADLLRLSKTDIFASRNIGKATFREIIEILAAYLETHRGEYSSFTQQFFSVSFDIRNPDFLSHISLEKMRPMIDDIFHDRIYSTLDLNDMEREYLELIKEAVKYVDKSLCKSVYDNPSYGMLLCDMCEDYVKLHTQELYLLQNIRLFQKAYEESSKLIRKLPNSLQQKPVVPFLYAFAIKEGDAILKLLELCTPETKISELPFIFHDAQKKERTAPIIDTIFLFLEWLFIDIGALRDSMLSDIHDLAYKKKKNALEMFNMRLRGSTLAEIASIYSLSRERVRTVVDKFYEAVWKSIELHNYEPIMLAYAFKEGSTFLTHADLLDLYGELGDFLWLAVLNENTHAFCGASNVCSYRYIEDYQAIVVSTPDIEPLQFHYYESLLTQSLPNIIQVENIDLLLSELSEKRSVPLMFIQRAFRSVYSLTGQFYYRNNIPNNFIYNYILKKHFPSGFKVSDDAEYEKFKQFYAFDFGEYPFFFSIRAVESNISKVGVLCDRGKYIHPDYMNVSPQVLKRIYDFIDQSPHSFLYFGDIFEQLKDVLQDSPIQSKYYLQGTIKKYGTKYDTGKDYIRKDTSTTIETELEAFMLKQKRCSFETISKAFPGTVSNYILNIIYRCPNIVLFNAKEYIHASEFQIEPSDYDVIRTYLTQACMDLPVHSYTVHMFLKNNLPEFLKRNNIQNEFNLIGILSYMFHGEFSFTKPYIGKLGETALTFPDIVKKILDDRDYVNVEELLPFYKKSGLARRGTLPLAKNIPSEYILINHNTLMKCEIAGVTDEIIEESARILNELLTKTDYIAGPLFSEFDLFPKLNVQWNDYLLESIIKRSGKVKIIPFQLITAFQSTAIYVSDKYKDDTYESFLVKILTPLVQSGFLKSKAHMKYWVREQALCGANFPNFLENTKYFYYDTEGLHCTEGEVAK